MSKLSSTSGGPLPAGWLDPPAWELQWGDSPLVASAIHDGGFVRAEVARLLAVDEEARFREEDPYTASWTPLASTRIVCYRSRFEVDLNRPRPRAVYRTPEDAWGLPVWKTPPREEVVNRSLAQYDAFYDQIRHVLTALVARHGRAVVFDLHSYNHRRQGPDAAPDDPRQNPQVNVGTGTLDRHRWGPLVDRFLAEMSRSEYLGERLDVRENVKFRGGHFVDWIHQAFPETVCALAIEVKKTFMDEWTGQVDRGRLHAIGRALQTAAYGVLEFLKGTP